MGGQITLLGAMGTPNDWQSPVIKAGNPRALLDLSGSRGCLVGAVATYPSAGGRRVTRGMRVPRKEYARSRHQRLFEENVGKTGKDAIYELLSERFGSCIYARGRY